MHTLHVRQRYHYLGYTPMSGRQLRYNVYADDQLVALLEPVLLETFVECERHRGTSYKAANWINVGQTVGRGTKSRVHQQIIPIKDIWLYPLRHNFRVALCA